MGKKDKRIDAYITDAPVFAQPILKRVRELIHKGCPEVTETMKWSFPHFEYKGVLCSVAAFKAHCRWVFWKSDLIKDAGMSKRLARITALSDLPGEAALLDYIREAAGLNEEGIKRAAPAKQEKKELVIPAVLQQALKKNAKAAKTFEAFSYSHKKEYAEWISEAKSDETRGRRLEQALEWMAEGKSRHWKYQRC